MTEFSEKPQIREGYINGGFFVLKREVFDYLSDDEDCIFEREPLERLARDDELRVFFHNDYWHCMDTLERPGYFRKRVAHRKSFVEGMGVACQIFGN